MPFDYTPVGFRLSNCESPKQKMIEQKKRIIEGIKKDSKKYNYMA